MMLINNNLLYWGRFLLASSTLFTLTFTHPANLFDSTSAQDRKEICSAINKYGSFCLGGFEVTSIGYITSIVILLVVMSGITPWLSSILHFWVAWSFQNTSTLIDGGDQLAVFLTFIIAIYYTGNITVLPHYSNGVPNYNKRKHLLRYYFKFLACVLIMGQMSIVYLNAAIHKMATRDWREGTAMYYLNGGYFGPPKLLSEAFYLLSDIPLITFAFSWATMLFEFLIGILVLIPFIKPKAILIPGISFHLGILCILGISSFQIVMISGLILTLAAHKIVSSSSLSPLKRKATS